MMKTENPYRSFKKSRRKKTALLHKKRNNLRGGVAEKQSRFSLFYKKRNFLRIFLRTDIDTKKEVCYNE